MKLMRFSPARALRLLCRTGLYVAALAGLSGCAGRGLNAVERMMWSTYPIATRKGMATGFVVNRRDPNAPDGRDPVVITSLHALSTLGRGPLMLGARVPDELGEPTAAVLQFQPGANRVPFYTRHPSHDIAAIPLRLPEKFARMVAVDSFLDEAAVARPTPPLRAGTEVSFLGFPEVLPGTAGAFPVLRTGRVASYPLDIAAADGLFVVNADVYPGDSGAPVFVSGFAGRPQLVGMIIRRIGQTERSFSHLAIAVDLRAIRETLLLVPAASAAGQQAFSPAQTQRSTSVRRP